MPTIGQLPVASTTTSQDEVPVSQAGVTRSVTVGELLATTQPVITLDTGTLLGRVSLGPGTPEPVLVASGLALTSGALDATGQDHLGFAVQPTLTLTDEVVLNSSGAPARMTLPLLRGLFTAGPNVALGAEGQISASTDPSVTGSLTTLGQAVAATQASVTVLAGEIPANGYVTLNAEGQVTAPVAGDVSAATVLVAATAQARSLSARGLDRFNVLDFGARQGGPDCTAAFNAAFAAITAGGGEIFIPAGDYWLASPLVWSGKPVAVCGEGKGISRLHFSHTGIGMDIASGNLLNRVVLRDFTAYPENHAGQTAALARITFPSASACGFQTAIVADVECIGYSNAPNTQSPFPQTFQRGIVLVGCWGTVVDNLSFFGPAAASGATQSYAIELNGSTDTRILAPNVHYGAGAVLQSGYCEGITLNNPLVVGCDYLMTQTDETTWPGYAPNTPMLIGLWVLGGECNTGLGTLLLSNVTVGAVSAMDITRNAGPSTGQTLFTFTDCTNFHILGCNVVGGGTGTVDTAFGFSSTWNSAGNIIGGCHLENLLTAVEIAGSNGTVALTTFALSMENVPSASAFIDNTPPENGNCITFRSPPGTGTPSGIGNTQDHVLAGKQGQSLFRVNNVAGAVNLLRCQPAASGAAPSLCFDGTDSSVAGVIQTKGGNLLITASGGAGSGSMLGLLSVTGAVNYIEMQNAAVAGNSVLTTNAGGLSMQPKGSLSLAPGAGLFASGLPTSKPQAGSGQIWNNGGVLSIA